MPAAHRWIAIFLAAFLSFGPFIPAAAPVSAGPAAHSNMAAMAEMAGNKAGRMHGCADCSGGVWMIGGNCLPLVLPGSAVSLGMTGFSDHRIDTRPVVGIGRTIPPALPPPIVLA
jgi:hypothetical protein